MKKCKPRLKMMKAHSHCKKACPETASACQSIQLREYHVLSSLASATNNFAKVFPQRQNPHAPYKNQQLDETDQDQSPYSIFLQKLFLNSAVLEVAASRAADIDFTLLENELSE